MDHDFQPLDSTRTSEQVAAALRRVIVRGTFRAGDTLPTERTLAERFRVTRNTIREALRGLEQSRLLDVRQGSGIRVRDYLENAGLEFVATVLSHADEHTQSWMRDIAEAWAVIGTALFEYAIQRVTPAALAPIRVAVDAFSRAAVSVSPDVTELQDLEIELHARLVRAAGNRVLVLLHNSIRHVHGQVRPLFAALMADPVDVAHRYDRMVTALERGDRDTARDLARAHFALGTHRLLENEP